MCIFHRPFRKFNISNAYIMMNMQTLFTAEIVMLLNYFLIHSFMWNFPFLILDYLRYIHK